jgi:hypothetical protein
MKLSCKADLAKVDPIDHDLGGIADLPHELQRRKRLLGSRTKRDGELFYLGWFSYARLNGSYTFNLGISKEEVADLFYASYGNRPLKDLVSVLSAAKERSRSATKSRRA